MKTRQDHTQISAVAEPSIGKTPVPSRPAPLEPQVSVIFFSSQRAFDAPGVLDRLLRWLDETRRGWEVVIALDGDRRELHDVLLARIAGRERARLVQLHARAGQLATIRAGAALCTGSVLITFPAYPQVECRSLPDLIEALASGADYVIGYRERRRSSFLNRMASALFNAGIGYATGVPVRDAACGVHGMRAELLPLIPDYGDTQFFLPIMAQREGLKVVQVPLAQDPAEPKVRVFRPAVLVNRFLSMVTIGFLMRFTQKPLRPIGLIGALLLLSGGLLGVVLAYQRLFQSRPLADRPMLLLALFLLTAGLQVVVLGLLGELLLYLHFRDQVIYRVDEQTPPRGTEAAADGKAVRDTTEAE